MEMLRRSRAQADPSAGSAVVLRNHPAGDRVDMFFRGGGLTGLRGGNCAGLGPCDDGPRGGGRPPGRRGETTIRCQAVGPIAIRIEGPSRAHSICAPGGQGVALRLSPCPGLPLSGPEIKTTTKTSGSGTSRNPATSSVQTRPFRPLVNAQRSGSQLTKTVTSKPGPTRPAESPCWWMMGVANR